MRTNLTIWSGNSANSRNDSAIGRPNLAFCQQYKWVGGYVKDELLFAGFGHIVGRIGNPSYSERDLLLCRGNSPGEGSLSCDDTS